METSARERLPAKWQRRFAVYDEAGGLSDYRETRAFKALSDWERLMFSFNPWAFFFGIIYYFILGIPKRGLGIGLCSFVVWCILCSVDASDGWFHAHRVATEAVFATLANYYYYIRVTQGRDSWDPLRDVRSV